LADVSDHVTLDAATRLPAAEAGLCRRLRHRRERCPSPRITRSGGAWDRDTASLATTTEQLGIASAANLYPDTLLDRMRNEAQTNSSVVVGYFQFGAWIRL
jgi:hypothetical protein